MNTKMTSRQFEILQFMKRHLVDNQRLPTIREIAAEFGMRSPNGVVYHLRALARHGAIFHVQKRRTMSYRLVGVVLRLEAISIPNRQVDEPSAETMSRRSDATTWSPPMESPNSLGERSLQTALTAADPCA